MPDGTLTLINSYTYSSWGAPTTTVAGGFSDLGFRFLYVGRYDVQWDNFSGLGLHYMRARHYAPSIGRFLQPDPSRADPNLFVHGADSPITMADPSGHSATVGGESGGPSCGKYGCLRRVFGRKVDFLEANKDSIALGGVAAAAGFLACLPVAPLTGAGIACAAGGIRIWDGGGSILGEGPEGRRQDLFVRVSDIEQESLPR